MCKQSITPQIDDYKPAADRFLTSLIKMEHNADSSAAMVRAEAASMGQTLDTLYGNSLWPEMEKLNLMMLKKNSCSSFNALPIGLKPIDVDRKRYEELSQIQLGIIDQLIYKIAHDDSFLVQLLEPMSQTDDFIGHLLSIHKKSLESRVAATKPYLAVIRSDYFLDQITGGWKQIEINTMSVAGGYFVDGIDTLFRNVKNRGYVSAEMKEDTFKANRAQMILDGLQAVHEIYLKSCQSSNPLAQNKTSKLNEVFVFENKGSEIICDNGLDCVNKNGLMFWDDRGDAESAIPAVLVVVRNYCEAFFKDQRGIINGLAARKIPVCVSTLEDVTLSQFERTAEENKLIIRCKNAARTFQISVVYFRAGYDPKDYVSEKCWDFVECAELSRAVLCPNVGLHLAGSKRVQCALGEEIGKEFIDLHFPNNSSRDLLLSTFVKQFELNEQNVEEVLKDPSRYVVKPQREGGTNNLFGENITSYFGNMKNRADLNRYIAMELIRSEIWRDFPVRTRDGDIERIPEAIAEVGVIGVLVVQPASSSTPQDTPLPKIIKHGCAAPLTKVKRNGCDEAGISVGHGFLASLSAN